MTYSESDLAKMKDPLWRLQNLYDCRSEGKGEAIKFVPRPEQMVIFNHLEQTPSVPVYVVKSRRLGISTAIDTFQADKAAFTSGWRGLIIDQKQDDATKKMVEIVRFAVDSLPREILADLLFDKRNDSELRLRSKNEPESRDSVIYATTGGRGGDCSMLHVSEWGPIAALDPVRSREIRTGTFPAARLARRVVETTWYGGKSGDLWELVKPIIEHNPNAEGVIYFFPWHSDPAAVKIDGMVTAEVEHYFRELAEKTQKNFSQDQKKWYAAKQLEQGIFIKREYPSTLDEAFSAPVEGSVYGDIINRLRAESRIANFAWNTGYPVFSSWDIGWADSMIVWLWQIVGQEVHWIWHTSQRAKTTAQMANLIDETGIPVTGHFIPHDGAQHSKDSGLTFKQSLEKAGLVNVTILPRSANSTAIWAEINALRDIFKRSWFRLPYCEQGVADLEAYHTKPTSEGGVVSREPVHDASSHSASAARYAAVACELGLVRGAAARKLVSSPPRYPDGAMVNIQQVKEERQRRRGALAIAGTPNL